MGEFIAFAVVIAAVIIAIGIVSAVKATGKAPHVVDTQENLLRTTVTVPRREQAQVLGSLVRILESGKHGEVEFYESQTSIVRIVIE